jgi:arsenate reductase (thioredoxin)
MKTDPPDGRHSQRSPASQKIRIRPADPRYPPKICIATDQSHTEFYFMTATGIYFPGMDVFVTRNFQPRDTNTREEKAAVVRVTSLGSGNVGVTVQITGSVTKRLAPKRVLFICIGNACRSVMAEALARHLAEDIILPSSAGLAPLGYVPSRTRVVLEEIGVSSAGQKSKPLLHEDIAGAEVLINLSGRPLENIAHVSASVEHWEVADPFGGDLTVYRSARDEIKRRLLELTKRLRSSAGMR